MSAPQPVLVPPAVGRGGWAAFFLSFFFPGAGQFYAGDQRLAAALWAICALVPPAALSACAWAPRLIKSFAVLMIAGYLVRLGLAIHAARMRVIERQPARAVAVFVVLTVAAGGVAAWAARRWYVEPFNLPSSGMVPSLEPGDQFFVLKSGPQAALERGAVIVFRRQDHDLVQRVIGLPGERVELREGVVFINGVALEHHDCLDGKVLIGHPDLMAPCVLESSGKFAWRTAAWSQPEGDGTWAVPAGAYFTLGDNRGYSRDSRFDGMVNAGDVKGRVEAVWLSFGRWPPFVVLDRIGARPYLPPDTR